MKYQDLCVQVRTNCTDIVRKAFENDPKHFRGLLARVEPLSILHLAVSEASFDMVDFLLTIGADLTQLTADKRTTLHLAADRGDIPIFSLILTNEPLLINSQDLAGNTPLHVAAMARNVHILDFTLS